MIYRQWPQVLLKMKCQTRRIVKPGERFIHDTVFGPAPLHRAKWVIGNTVSVQPKYGHEAVGRIRITDIRQEPVQAITAADAWAEGIRPFNPAGMPILMFTSDQVMSLEQLTLDEWLRLNSEVMIHAYAGLWDSINTTRGTRWQDNPSVWVLTFECVEWFLSVQDARHALSVQLAA